MRLTFGTRLTLEWTVSFALVLAATNLVIYAGARRFLEGELDREARTVAGTEAASMVDDAVRGIHVHEFEPASVGLGQRATFAQVVTAEGQLVLSSRDLQGVPPLLSPARLAEALQGRPPIVDVFVAGRPGRAVGVRRDEAGRTYVVVAGLFRDGLHRNLRHLSRFLLAVWLAGVLLTAALGRGLAIRVLRPVTAITDRAAAIAGGDLRGRLGPPLGDDEIGRMTERLNAMLERLQDALEANRRFAASASHELRTPLAAIRAEVEVVLRRERTPEEYRQALLAVGSRALEMGELIADLRALVRALEGRPELELREVPLEPAIEASLTRQQEAIDRRGLEVETSGLAGLVAYGDARLLARLFDNLLANGARHCRPGGKLGVRGEAEAGGPGWNSGRVRLRFSNQGPEIPAEDWERIFAPFTRGALAEDAPPEAGFGLGLAIAREVARLHHGQVRVLDSGDEGTTFEVVLRGDRLTSL